MEPSVENLLHRFSNSVGIDREPARNEIMP